LLGAQLSPLQALSIDPILVMLVSEETTGSLGRASRVGRYRLIRRIGRGGMAEVYLAHTCEHPNLRREVAVKLVLPHLHDEPEFMKMFLREAAIAGRLNHPNIVGVIDFGQDEGDPYLVMEYVQGRPLRQVVHAASQYGGLSLSAGLTIVRDIAKALHHAHEARDEWGVPLGIVHRDVSPSNVLVRYDGIAKLADFGIAKATNQFQTTIGGTLKGKLGYMSPEQCRCEPLDRRSDVFGLGVLLYETTLGRRVFGARNEFGVLGKVLRGEFARPSTIRPNYPPQLERIVLKALELETSKRYQSTLELERDLDRFAAASGVILSQSEMLREMERLFPPVDRTQSMSWPNLVEDERGNWVGDESITAPMDLGAASEPVTGAGQAVRRPRPRSMPPLVAALGGALMATGVVLGALELESGWLRRLDPTTVFAASDAQAQAIGSIGAAAPVAAASKAARSLAPRAGLPHPPPINEAPFPAEPDPLIEILPDGDVIVIEDAEDEGNAEADKKGDAKAKKSRRDRRRASTRRRTTNQKSQRGSEPTSKSPDWTETLDQVRPYREGS
jgi:serine/threonine protein kinase